MEAIEQVREGWRKKASEVAKRVVAPRAAEIDETGEFAWDLVEEYSKHGFLTLLIPKEYGGMDADITSFCLIAEEIANYCASSALLVIVQAVGTMPLALGGTQELKENFL
ncbi:MAG: acyl-CoA dehydrogenase family protein, partial [Thermodesulfobacteriota bacterium]